MTRLRAFAVGSLVASLVAIAVSDAFSQTASVTLTVVNPLVNGEALQAVDVKMSVGERTVAEGRTSSTGQFRGGGFRPGQTVKILYSLGGYVSFPMETSVITKAGDTLVSGSLVRSTATASEVPNLIRWIEKAGNEAPADRKGLVYSSEWERVIHLSPDVQRLVGSTLAQGAGNKYLADVPSFRNVTKM